MRHKVKYLIISLIISILSAFFIIGYLKVRNFAEAIANEDAARGRTVEKYNNCATFLRKAKENLNVYYEKKDIYYLRIAKTYLDSIDCGSFRYKMFNTKITVLLLSKDYKEGIKYISSLDSSSFKRSYMKSMYLNRFKGLESESRSDIIQRNQYYNEGLSAIHLYMGEHPTDKESLFDYYILKMLFNDHAEVIKEVESLKSLKIYENDFLDTLIETLNNFEE